MFAVLLVIAFGALWSTELGAQVRAHDLPVGFRSLAGVTLNRDSAKSIRAKLGPTRERRVGMGHDSSIDWCYTATRPSHELTNSLLELMSDASSMGTPGRELNVIRLRADAPPGDRDGCARLPASAVLSTDDGLRLGLSSAQIQQLLGVPTRATADSLIYEFVAKEFLRPDTPAYDAWDTSELRESCFDAGPPYANIAATVTVVLRDRRAIEITVERYDKSIC